MKKHGTLLIFGVAMHANLAAAPTFTVDASRCAGKVSPRLYPLPPHSIVALKLKARS
jgi:hypothetical protein